MTIIKDLLELEWKLAPSFQRDAGWTRIFRMAAQLLEI